MKIQKVVAFGKVRIYNIHNTRVVAYSPDIIYQLKYIIIIPLSLSLFSLSATASSVFFLVFFWDERDNAIL